MKKIEFGSVRDKVTGEAVVKFYAMVDDTHIYSVGVEKDGNEVELDVDELLASLDLIQQVSLAMLKGQTQKLEEAMNSYQLN